MGLHVHCPGNYCTQLQTGSNQMDGTQCAFHCYNFAITLPALGGSSNSWGILRKNASTISGVTCIQSSISASCNMPRPNLAAFCCRPSHLRYFLLYDFKAAVRPLLVCR